MKKELNTRARGIKDKMKDYTYSGLYKYVDLYRMTLDRVGKRPSKLRTHKKLKKVPIKKKATDWSDSTINHSH